MLAYYSGVLYTIGVSSEGKEETMRIQDFIEKVAVAVAARLLADGIKAAAKKALHREHRPKHMR